MIKAQKSENSSEENLFEKMANLPPHQQSKKLQRSKSNVVLAGVCSGIADYMKIEVAHIRLIALLSLLMGGWSVVAYIITALLLPEEKDSAELTVKEKSSLQKENFKTVLSGLFILSGLHFTFIYIDISSSERIFSFPNGFVFPIAAIAAGVFILTKRYNLNAANYKINTEKFFRSVIDKKFMGVCGGLGKYLNIDSFSLRIIFVLSSMLTFGVFAIIYLLFSVFTNLESRQNFEE